MINETIETETAAEVDTRVDESAAAMFAHLGFKGRLPDSLVGIYNDFRRTKDSIRPGNLSAEGYAFVVTLYKLGG